VGLAGADPGSIAVRTFTSPSLDAAMATNEWWRRAEIPAANGQGNARSVATIQSVIAGGGEARGVRLLSTTGCDTVFEEQSNSKDLVLGMPMRFGMGYGLSGELMPMGPRACFWGGYGGSLIVMDQDARMTVSYVMNRMESGLTGDLRGGNVVMAAVMGLAGGSD
jgi:CubicO group peptidase (beta-lactamase class C family)